MTTKEKMERLERAFTKAIEASIGGIDEQEFQECFGEIQADVGRHHLEEIYADVMEKLKANMKSDFRRITEHCNVADYVGKLSTHFSEEIAPPTFGEDMSDVAIKLKKMEIIELQSAIKLFEAENRKLKDMSGRLRTQMMNEVEALNEENLKIQNAATSNSSANL